MYKVPSAVGYRQHKLFHCWRNMLRRCYDERDPRYKSHGGRGVVVCKRWHCVANFIEDVWPSYEVGLQIERKNNDGNYTPRNCRWATRVEQARNRRDTRFITYAGETLALAEWSARTGLYHSVILRRLNRGWSEKRALTTPPDLYHKLRRA